MKILNKRDIFFEYSIPENLEDKFERMIEISSDGRFDTYDEYLELVRLFEEYKAPYGIISSHFH